MRQCHSFLPSFLGCRSTRGVHVSAVVGRRRKRSWTADVSVEAAFVVVGGGDDGDWNPGSQTKHWTNLRT